VPYELPLILLDDTVDRPTYKFEPELGTEPYVLITPWKGVSWNESAWTLSNEGAARWVGEPNDSQISRWRGVYEQDRESTTSDMHAAETPAVQILRLTMARHLSHHYAS